MKYRYQLILLGSIENPIIKGIKDQIISGIIDSLIPQHFDLTLFISS